MSAPILFLDLARQTGWCEGAPGEKPISGSLLLAPTGGIIEDAGAGLLRFLAARFALQKYHSVVFEAPMDPRHMKTNVKTIRMLNGLCFAAGSLAVVQGITLREVSVHDVRKHLMGRSPRGEGTKELVMQAVRERGFQPTDDNEADAIAGWLYAESEFFRVRNGQKPNPQKNLI